MKKALVLALLVGAASLNATQEGTESFKGEKEVLSAQRIDINYFNTLPKEIKLEVVQQIVNSARNLQSIKSAMRTLQALRSTSRENYKLIPNEVIENLKDKEKKIFLTTIAHAFELRKAIFDRDIDKVKSLIEKGVDVNYVQEGISKGKRHEVTHYPDTVAPIRILTMIPLRIQVDPFNSEQNLELFTLLLEHRAQANIDLISDLIDHLDNKYALAAIQILIQKAIDLNSKNTQGDTLLHKMARNIDNRYKIAGLKLLLEAGADPHIKNNKGQTPLGILQEYTRLKKNVGDILLAVEAEKIITQAMEAFKSEKR